MFTQKERIPFDVPMIANDAPLSSHPFADWLRDNVTYGDYYSIISLQCRYLDDLGFITGKHSVSDDWFTQTQYVADAYCRSMCPGGDTRYTLSDLFEPSEDGYLVRGMEQKQAIKPTLLAMLERTSCIYPLEPVHYYFEIVQNDRLFIKYQSIIGDRKVCLLEMPNAST